MDQYVVFVQCPAPPAFRVSVGVGRMMTNTQCTCEYGAVDTSESVLVTVIQICAVTETFLRWRMCTAVQECTVYRRSCVSILIDIVIIIISMILVCVEGAAGGRRAS